MARITSYYPLAGFGVSDLQIARVVAELEKGATLEKALTRIRRADLIGQPGIKGMFQRIKEGMVWGLTVSELFSLTLGEPA